MFIYFQIKISDFGLSGNWEESKKRGGTPLYASFQAFGGYQTDLDEFSYSRLMLFLCLSPADFIQLTCFPIEDELLLESIRTAINSFDILKKILKGLNDYKGGSLVDLSKYSKVKISRNDLINAGIDRNWFIDSLPVGHKDTLQSENFRVQDIR